MTEFCQPASLGTTMGILLRSLRSSSQKTIADHVFPERAEFEAGLLPLQSQVFEVKTKKDRRTEKWKKEKADPYVDRISHNLFDISTQDKDFLKKQESFYGAKMSENEWDFLEDQRLERKM